MRCGFVGLIGRPNAGKSTLINQLIGQKIAIVSAKPQTTRNEIRGIYTSQKGQIIFTDTPGIHKPKVRLESRMNQEASDVMMGVDVIYCVIDGSVPFAKGDQFVLDMIKRANLPTFLILNKIDKMAKEKVMENLLSWQKRFDFAEYFPISALQDKTFERLIETTLKYLPESEILYPEQMKYDTSDAFQMAELVREKILTQTEQEVPHACGVLIEKMEIKKKAVYIQAMIVVERDGQKSILLGKQGSMIKKIGMLARQDMERFFEKKVYLELFVRVEKDWRTKDARINDFGYAGSYCEP